MIVKVLETILYSSKTRNCENIIVALIQENTLICKVFLHVQITTAHTHWSHRCFMGKNLVLSLFYENFHSVFIIL